MQIYFVFAEIYKFYTKEDTLVLQTLNFGSNVKQFSIHINLNNIIFFFYHSLAL